MCKYCQPDRQKIVNDQIPLIDYDLNMGILGHSKICLYIYSKREGSFLKLQFDSYGMHGGSDKILGTINFCPMCGRSLQKGD